MPMVCRLHAARDQWWLDLETGGEAVFLSERRNMPLGKAPRPHLSYGIQSHHMVRAKSPPQVVAWHLSLGYTLGWGLPSRPRGQA